MPVRRHAQVAEFFGHPKGLAFIFGCELFERLSHYGVYGILTLYFGNELFTPGRLDNVTGHDAVKSLIEIPFGELTETAFAAHLIGFYTAFASLMTVAGGFLADRMIGRTRSIIAGTLILACGYFLMTVDRFFLPALLLTMIGAAAFVPNNSSQVGDLYTPEDRRRDRAFSIFYIGINIGALLAPLVCGTLAEKVSYKYAFATAGISMLMGLAIYVAGLRNLPVLDPVGSLATPGDAEMSGSRQRRAVLALVIVALLQILFWAPYEQWGISIVKWTETFTDRWIDLGRLHVEIPVTWFQAINPFIIIAGTPLLIAFWARQAKRNKEPPTLMKMSFGCVCLAAANLLLCVVAWRTGEHGKASWLWLVVYYAILTLGEIYLSPIGLSLVTKLAPKRMISLTMGLWISAGFATHILAGWLGSLWEKMSKPLFFLMLAAMAGVAALAIATVNRSFKDVFATAESPPQGVA